MATEEKFIVSVTDGGTTDKTVKKFNDLRDAAKEAGAAANKVGAGTAGSRAAAQAARPSGGMETQQYNALRGTAGVTGASARDFAKQSEGLGGLVRLYATYAANLYAATAAFNALKSAQDTTNMVRGLEQLGAVSGVALGAVSKRLTEVTQGALSLRESMKVTAQVTSAGFGSMQVEAIGKAGTKIAQALGLDAADAITRLTRAVTKLEPELLDELGIFLKIDDVVQKYALSVGKTTSQVTEFERRQAFLNAALDQSNTKFGEIQLDVNPYNQLAASLANVGQKIAEVLNNVIGPFVSLLASSPTALYTTVVALAAVLLKQAVPAITDFREGLRRSTEDAAYWNNKRKDDAIAAETARAKEIEDKVRNSADKQLKIVEDAEAKMNALKDPAKKKGGLLGKVAKADAQEIEEKGYIQKLRDKADAEEKKGRTASAQSHREYAEALDGHVKAEKELARVKAEARAAAEKDPGLASTRGQAIKASLDSERNLVKSNIIANAGYAGSIDSLGNSFRGLNKDIKESNLTPIGKANTYVQGTFAILTGKISTAVSAFGAWGMAVGIGIQVAGLLNDWLSSNTEETNKYNQALDQLKATTKNTTGVLERFSEVDPLGKLTVQSTLARATAINELTQGLTKTIDTLLAVDKAAGKWDRFWDGAFSVVGADLKSTSARQIGVTIADIIASADEGPAKEAYKQKVKEIFGSTNAADITKIAEMRGPEKYTKSLKEGKKATEELNKSQQEAASRLKEVEDAFVATDKAYKELSQSVSQSTPLTKFAEQLQASGKKLQDELLSPEMTIKTLVGLLNNPSKGGFLSMESYKLLQDSAQEIRKVFADIDAAQKKITANETKLADPKFGNVKTRAALTNENKGLIEQVNKLQESAQTIAAPIVKALALERFEQAGKVLAAETTASLARASVAIGKSYSSLFTGPRAAQLETNLAKEELAVRISNLEATKNLIQSNQLLRVAIERDTAQKVLDNPKSTKLQKDTATRTIDESDIKTRILKAEDPRKLQQEFIKGNTREGVNAALGLESEVKALTDVSNQVNEAKANLKATTIQGAINIARAAGVEKANQIRQEAEITKERLKQLDSQVALNGFMTDEQLATKQTLQDEIQGNEARAQRLGLETEIEILGKQQVRKQDEKLKLEELSKKNTELKLVKDLQSSQVASQDIKQKQDSLDLELQKLDRIYRIESANRAEEQKALEFRIQMGNRQLALEEEILTARQNLGVIDETSFIAQKSALDIKKLDAQLNNEIALANAKNTEELAAQQKIIDDNTKKYEASGKTNEEFGTNITRATNAQARLRGELGQTTSQLQQENTVRKNIVIQAAELAKFEANTARTARIKNIEIDIEYNKLKLTSDLAQSKLDVDTSALELKKASLLITEKEYILEKSIQDIRKIDLDTTSKADAARADADKQRAKFTKELEDAQNRLRLAKEDDAKQAAKELAQRTREYEATQGMDFIRSLPPTVVAGPSRATQELELTVEKLTQESQEVDIRLNNTLTTIEKIAKQDKLRVQYAAELQAFIEEQNRLYKVQQDLRDLEFARLDRAIATEQSRLNIQSMLLEGRKNLGFILDKEYQSQKATVDLQKAQMDGAAERNRLSKESADRAATTLKDIAEAEKRLDIANKAAAASAPPTSSVLFMGTQTTLGGPDSVAKTTGQMQSEADLERLKQRQEEEKLAADAKLVALTREQSIREYLIQLQGEQNVLQARQTEEMQKANRATELFNSLFVDMKGRTPQIAKAIGDIGSAIMTNSHEQEKLNQQRHAEIRIAEMSSNNEEEFAEKSQQIHKRYAKEQTKLDLDTAIKGIGAAKMLFKEKTAAHKAFAALEKALAIARMIQDGQVLAAKIANQGAEFAIAAGGFYSKLPFYIGDIYGKTIGQLGPIAGPVVATGLIAALLSMVGGGGGKGKAPPMVTAAQRQETQGTAMGYNEMGEKIQVRRGVFGDENAKSESISKSLDLIAANSVDGLNYDNKMLNALKDLKDALTESAQALFGIKGLRAGSMFGTQEGTNTSGGFLGIGGLFSSSTTRSIVDSGLQLKGTFLELARTGGGLINTFEVVSTTNKSSGFLGLGGSTSTSQSTNFRDLGITDPKAEASLRAAFGYAADLISSVGEQAGKLPQEIEMAMSNAKVDELVSLRGLTGEDFIKQLEAVVGSVLDDTALVLFSEFEKFAKFGEGMLETVVRVVDTNTKVNQAIKNIGTSITGQVETSLSTSLFGITLNLGSITNTYSKLTNDITEALVKSAGGLDKFLDKVEGFRSNFLTEQERLAPIAQAYRKGLTDLGYSADISRDQLKQLIQNFNLFDPAAGRAGKSAEQTYVALLDIADGFDKVADAAEAAAKKVSDEREGLQRKLDELLLSNTQLRELDIQKIDITNRALQRQIWAQQDVQTAAKALQTRLSDVTKTINGQITSLTDYRQSLMVGDKSTLTQIEQYQQAKQNLTELFRTANDSTATDEVRNTALGKIQGASDQVLGLSRQLYASGAQYSADQATVIGILDATKADLEKRKTNAELQLTQLQNSNSFLDNIQSNTKSTVDLLAEFLAAQSVYNTAANQPGASRASFAVGTNYVPNDMIAEIHQGERIIPAADNVTLIANNKEMLQEIRQLNQRIVKLEQAIVEGNMINAAATDRNTDAIVVAIESGTDTTLQFNRLQKKGTIK
jgi:hypothetical protein